MSPAKIDIPSTWSGMFTVPYPRSRFDNLTEVIERSYDTEEVYPSRENLFRALELVSPQNTKVVILGQDPYPTPDNAHGLSFSVMPPRKAPASLLNIFRELERSIPGWTRPNGGCLEPWARQGVLLLNTVLTVRAGAPMSHCGRGWEDFSNAVLRHAQDRAPFIVFLLWGAKALATAQPVIDSTKHAILHWSHPSPMAQNRLPHNLRFVGNNHFAMANRLLTAHGGVPIDWRL